MNKKQQIVAAAFLALISTASVRAETIEYSNVMKSVATVSLTPVSPARLLRKDVPLTLSVKDLNSDWQFITLNNSTSRTEGAPLKKASSIPEAIDQALHVAPDVFLTQWQTASNGGQSFLIAYHVVPMVTSEEFRSFLESETLPMTGRFAMRSEFLDFLKGVAERQHLELTLLNLQTINVVRAIKPYDIKERDASLMFYIFASGFQETPNKLDFQSLANLKQLAAAVLAYAQDYDEVCPPMQSIPQFKKAVFPYVKDDEVFVQPGNKTPYAVNVALSGRNLTKVKSPETFATIYEAKIGSDGRRAVGFADGHVKRVTVDEWTKIKKDSNIK